MLNFEKWFYTNEKIINLIIEKQLTREQKQDLINEIENAKNLVINLKASNIGIIKNIHSNYMQQLLHLVVLKHNMKTLLL
jgi:alpha-galactosidase/6-phospho-beta-glucosidase family protein